MMSISVEFWHWLVIGVIFLALEVFVPGAILMWFGFGGLLTGVLLWLIPSMTLNLQILIFSLFSIASIFLWKKYGAKADNVETDNPNLNNRWRDYIGRETLLIEPIENGTGLAKVGDSAWKVRGKDMPKGTRVKIVDIDGLFFVVEEVSQ